MGEKRKPTFVFLLKKPGKKGFLKKHKIEVFPASLWLGKTNKYRIRVDGKWFPEKQALFFYRSEIRDLIWRSIKF